MPLNIWMTCRSLLVAGLVLQPLAGAWQSSPVWAQKPACMIPDGDNPRFICPAGKIAVATKNLGGTKRNAFLSIHGDRDDRKEYFEIKGDTDLETFASSSVALIRRSLLSKSGGKFAFKFGLNEDIKPLFKEKQLCPGESFCDQPSAAFCSGTLVIASDLILTAAHCFDVADNPKAATVENTAFVFHYRIDNQGGKPRTSFDEEQVCFAKKRLDGSPETFGAPGADWKLVRLDCKVPATVASPVTKIQIGLATVKPNQQLRMFGYPSGMPLKYVDDGMVLKESGAQSQVFFHANLDAFEVTSGGGVYRVSGSKLELVGIMRKGQQDYDWENGIEKGCRRACAFPEGSGASEDVTRISTVKWPPK